MGLQQVPTRVISSLTTVVVRLMMLMANADMIRILQGVNGLPGSM